MKKEKDNNVNIISRKVILFPLGDKDEVTRVYKYLRDGMEAQNKAMNQYMSTLYSASLLEVTKEDRKELHNLYSRISESKLGSAYPEDIQFAKGLPTGSLVSRKVEQDFSTAMKKGLRYGRVSLTTYRATNPLLVHRDYVRLWKTNPHLQNGLYHNYVNDEEFKKHLYDPDLEILLKFANGIVFKVVFGNPHKSADLRRIFGNIFDGTYDVNGSSIQIDDGKIILNLSITVPKQTAELDESTVVGVDLGLAIPAVCAVNNTPAREYIGSREDFLRVRMKIQAQRRSLQRNLQMSKGGHGRKKKMAPLDRYKDYEANWVQTYNHMVSRRVVDFAIENKAKYINLENLEGISKEDKKKFILRNWSYYQLQQYITYKAEMAGITVRKIDPSYTSQTCSECGNLEKSQRKSQSVFVCANPECNNYNEEVNADYNAAKNIAISTRFVQEEESKKSKKKNKTKISEECEPKAAS